MDHLRRLGNAVLDAVPEVRMDLEEPERAQQAGWLDIEYDGLSVVVEWRPGVGFGVSRTEHDPSDPSKGLFEGPDEVFDDWHRAKDHILFLLHTSSHTLERKRSARR